MCADGMLELFLWRTDNLFDEQTTKKNKKPICDYTEKLDSGATNIWAFYVIPRTRCSRLCLLAKGSTLFNEHKTYSQVSWKSLAFI